MGRAIDVSKYQGTIDFDVLPADIDVVLMQATFDLTGVDPNFDRNLTETVRTNRTPVPYHFAYPHGTDADAEAQAEHFYGVVSSAVGALPVTMRVRLALDLEEAGGSVEWAHAFLVKLCGLDGITPLFYSYLNFILDQLDGGRGLGDVSLLWLADVTATPPACPPGWSQIDLWQHAQAIEPGISTGVVDEDAELNPLPALEDAMDPATFVKIVYACVLYRPAAPQNLVDWGAFYTAHGAAATFAAIAASPEAVEKHTKITGLLGP